MESNIQTVTGAQFKMDIQSTVQIVSNRFLLLSRKLNTTDTVSSRKAIEIFKGHIIHEISELSKFLVA